MSALKIYPIAGADSDGGDADPDSNSVQTFRQTQAISEQLQKIGILFESWPASANLAMDASSEDILAAYREPVDALKAQHGLSSADVISLGPNHPERQALRQKFLSEHSHSDFEVRFFVAGQGLFSIHHNDHVYAVLCCQGDLISIPAGTLHWFDMGPQPSFTCIRLFADSAGWVADYSGNSIADQFPRLDPFVAVIG